MRAAFSRLNVSRAEVSMPRSSARSPSTAYPALATTSSSPVWTGSSTSTVSPSPRRSPATIRKPCVEPEVIITRSGGTRMPRTLKR